MGRNNNLNPIYYIVTTSLLLTYMYFNVGEKLDNYNISDNLLLQGCNIYLHSDSDL